MMISFLIAAGVAFILILLVIDIVWGGYIFLSCLSAILDASSWISANSLRFFKKIWNLSFRFRSKV